MYKQLAQSTTPISKSTLSEHIECTKNIKHNIKGKVNFRLLNDDVCPAMEPASESDSNVEMLNRPPGAY